MYIVQQIDAGNELSLIKLQREMLKQVAEVHFYEVSQFASAANG